jgi:hypothetical protein
MPHLLFSLALVALCCVVVQSLDVEVVGIKCDESLPVTAELKLKDCVAGSRCTFGQEATVYGSCTSFVRLFHLLIAWECLFAYCSNSDLFFNMQ